MPSVRLPATLIFVRNIFQAVLVALCTTAFSIQAAVLEFRIDQDRLWLNAQNEPLSQLLEHFAAAGIAVQIDPDAQKTITGSCQAADIESALEKLLSPYNYLLDWQRESGPLGELTRLTGIRVFRAGCAESVRPLRSERRIETSFDGKSRFIAREILVGFRPGSSIQNLQAFLAHTGGTVISANTELGIYRILLPEGTNVPDLVNQLGNEGSIAHSEPNYVYDVPGIKKFSPSIYSEKVSWAASSGISPIAVAVLDTGLAPDDQLNRAVINSFDATHPDAALTSDDVGHGTLMAQLAAGLIDPYKNPTGEGVPVVAIKAFANDGYADSFTLMNAMTYAVKTSSGPVSLSWGSETSSKFIEVAVQYAVSQGHPVFSAVGNENTGKPMYPAAYPGVTGVAASDGDRLADYSNRGDFVDLIAPGSVGDSKGTSVATAYVAHIAALYMQHHPGITATETVAALKTAAGPTGFLTEPAVKRLLAH
ncbi:MAG: S8 family serine peptidase [Kiritimatiellales bacterium]